MIAQELLTEFQSRLSDIFRIDRQGFFVAMAFGQIFALERAGDGDFTLSTAADGADIGVDGGTGAAGAALSA